MLQNYITIAWRNLRKHPTTTSIHLLGLTVGLSTCLFIALFVRYEWGFDRFHRLSKRIYRVNMMEQNGQETTYTGTTPYPLGEAMRTDLPDLATIARIHEEEKTFVVISPEKILSEEAALFADPELLAMFDYHILSGDAKKALKEPNQAFLSESTAYRYFGTQDVIGKTFRLGSKVTLQVAGVMQDMPAQTSLKANLLVSYPTLKDYFALPIDQWGLNSAGSVFVLLPDGAAPSQYETRLQGIARKYMKPEGGETRTLMLQALRDIHSNTRFKGTQFVPAVAPVYLWVFGVIGCFMLLIACVNFINLSTARALIRTREVGVRKSMGATGGQLIAQFMSETLWLTALSALLTLLLTHALLPTFNRFLEKNMRIEWIEALAFVTVLTLFTTLIAGLYPALMISRFNPVRALKGYRQSNSPWQIWLRQGLVVFQFTISLVLAVGVGVIYQQMKLFREKDLGFQQEAVLTLKINRESSQRPAFRDMLSRIPGVESVTFTLGAPTTRDNLNTEMKPDPEKPEHQVGVNVKMADSEYLQTYGLQLLAGRFLQPSDTLRNSSVIPFEDRAYVFVVNEAAMRAMGYSEPEKVLGRRIQIGINEIEAEIIGVVKDFHTTSLREPIKPVVLMNLPYFYHSVGLRLRTANYAATLAKIERTWKQFNPNILYEATFLDDSIHELYKEEARQFTLLQVFAAMALVIACLGLWGLSTFLIEQRTKEIGIRKVLGASVRHIVTLLSKDFIKLVVLAFLIASPLAWLLMNRWLQDFAYRIPIGWEIFAWAGGAGLFIALFTISFRAIKAALANPVKSLRTE
jgi:predicted permease